jgi:hypothetical protein
LENPALDEIIVILPGGAPAFSGKNFLIPLLALPFGLLRAFPDLGKGFRLAF